MADWILPLGGFICGAVAGAAARRGRLCTMGAIEDVVVAGDYRRAKAWGLALAVAAALTQAFALAGWIDPAQAIYGGPRLDLLGAVLGGAIFGVGMALAGTCGFGLLVRAGGGDLRAFVSAGVMGVVAFAATAGVLEGLRAAAVRAGTVDLGFMGGPLATEIAARHFGPTGAALVVLGGVAALALFALSDQRLRRKPRLLAASGLIGAAVAGGWLATGPLADPFGAHRLESLTFVAPIGRLILQIMSEALSNAGFGVGSVLGVMAGSFAVAMAQEEGRFEAFDDPREMKRHLLGAALMGLGGVLARGCTIGQGLSAGSLTSISTPLVLGGIVLGAALGLRHLIEGRPLFSFRRGSAAE